MKKNIESECSILDGLPQELHPFDTTCRIHEKLSALGWIWHKSTEAADKVREELGEAQEAESQKDREHLEEECGDLLFSALSYINFLGIDPKKALERVNHKFYGRFSYMEKRMKESGLSFGSGHEAEESAFWREAKAKGL